MTLHVDFDRNLWLYIPQEWPWEEHETRDTWRDTVVRLFTEAYQYTEDMQGWLGATLDGFVEGCASGEHRFAYMPTPHEVVSLVSLYELPPSPHVSTDEMLGVNDSRAARPPAVAPFVSPVLGEGVKSLRYITEAPPADPEVPVADLLGVAHWLWRLADRDIIMVASSFNLAEFHLLQERFDDFARAISLHDATLNVAPFPSPESEA